MALVIENKPYFDEVMEFATKIGLRDQLEDKLRFLDRYAEHGDRGKTRCRLRKDFAPASFEFVMERRNSEGGFEAWFVGGLILHGAHDNKGDGSFPTLSVTISPTTGWQIHT